MRRYLKNGPIFRNELLFTNYFIVHIYINTGIAQSNCFKNQYLAYNLLRIGHRNTQLYSIILTYLRAQEKRIQCTNFTNNLVLLKSNLKGFYDIGPELKTAKKTTQLKAPNMYVYFDVGLMPILKRTL